MWYDATFARRRRPRQDVIGDLRPWPAWIASTVRVLLVGADGQLGRDVAALLVHEDLLSYARNDLDITDAAAVDAAVRAHRPDVVVNAAAYNRVDDCESNVDLAFRVNGEGPRNLATACRGRACLVHVSTDYVFDGARGTPYDEADHPNPISAYGISKLCGELFVRSLCDRHVVVRSSALFGLGGSRAKGGNFVEAVLRQATSKGRLQVVNDQVTSPTFTRDLADALVRLIRAGATGTVHVANAGACTWYEFARTILGIAGRPVPCDPIDTVDVAGKARRPRYSALISRRLGGFAIELRPWHDALAEYLTLRGHQA